MTGRPTLYTDELADEICLRVLTRPVHQVCDDEDMPGETTFYVWLSKHPEFRDKYARAREARAFRRVESIDQTIAEMRSGALDPAVGRIEIDARKWQAGKENQKAFGDKVQVDAKVGVSVVPAGDHDASI